MVGLVPAIHVFLHAIQDVHARTKCGHDSRRLTKSPPTTANLHGHGFADSLQASRRLRAELRRITRRDYFPPAERDQAKASVEALTLQSADADVQEQA